VTASSSDTDLTAARNAATGKTVAIVFITADSGEGYITVEGNQGDRNNLNAWHSGVSREVLHYSSRLSRFLGRSCLCGRLCELQDYRRCQQCWPDQHGSVGRQCKRYVQRLTTVDVCLLSV
jgi:hypothetical protein